MRSLFVKIFSWFWFTVIMVGIAIAGSVLYSARSFEAQKSEMISAIFGSEAKTLVEAAVRDGKAAAVTHISDLEQKYHIRVYFFAAEDLRFFDTRKLPAEVQKMALFAIRDEGVHIAGPYVSQRLSGPNGETFALVIATSPGPNLVKTNLLLFETPLIILIAGGVFCFLIARTVTSPLERLSAAAEGIAAGHLETRAGTDLQKRHDEIGGLGRDFDRMAERIQALVGGQQDLLANVSHELRSPLARLNVALALLQRERPGEESEHVKRIAVEAHRLDKLIGQLLMLSRLDSKVFASAGTSFNLTNLIQAVVSDADFEARAMSRRAEATAMDVCTVIGHEELIRSAVENVARNAVRYTAKGTTVEVSLRLVNASPGLRAVLRVRDHGTGVPEAMLNEIFNPFTRALSSLDNGSGGTGLGLTIAQKAVIAHQGEIRARNAPDGGLIVEIEIPASL